VVDPAVSIDVESVAELPILPGTATQRTGRWPPTHLRPRRPRCRGAGGRDRG